MAIAILRIRFPGNTSAQTWTDTAVRNWMDPAVPFSLGSYWLLSGWGQYDIAYELFAEITVADPRGSLTGDTARNLLEKTCVDAASRLVGLTAERFAIVMMLFEQRTDMFGGGGVAVPLASGGTKTLSAVVLDPESWFSGCCQELGHAYGFEHELTPNGSEYGSPYSAMSARVSSSEFLRPADPKLPNGAIVTSPPNPPSDPFLGKRAQHIVAPMLPAAQMHWNAWFRASPHVRRLGYDQIGRTPVVTLHALDFARGTVGVANNVASVVLSGAGPRHLALELRRQKYFDRAVKPAVVVHSFDADANEQIASRVVYEGAMALPAVGTVADQPFPAGPFTLRLIETGPDNQYVRLQAFRGVWTELDANGDTVDIVADGPNLYQLHRTGAVWKYTGVPHTGWALLDSNSETVAIAASGGNLYQRHRSGRIWRYTGTPQWQELDANGDTVDIVADGPNLYQLHRTGAIWKYTGVPRTGWARLDANSDTVAIAAGGGNLYQRHRSGRIWYYTGTPQWQELDANGDTVDIVADGPNLYQRHRTGAIWKYTGVPHTGWAVLDTNADTRQIAAANGQLFQLHGSGRIWRYDGTPHWFELDRNANSRKIAAGAGRLYQLHKDGRIWSLDL